MTELIRSFTPDLEIRSAAKGGDGRTVMGILVPYFRPQRINDRLIEQFAGDANHGPFDHQFRAAHRVRYSREHIDLGGVLIGRLVEMRNDAAGAWGALQVSKTAAGEETLELIKDGALPELSIGFREKQNRREPDGTTTRVTADLIEVSSVLEGAYGDGAMVSAVRAARGHVCSCGQNGNVSVSDSLTNAERARRILAGVPVLPAV